MKLLTLFVTITVISLAQEFENVQVLPFESKKEMMKYMKKTVSKSLGVKCKYCHNLKDYADDRNPHKLVAREMMRMVEAMNTHLDSAFAIGLKAEKKQMPESQKESASGGFPLHFPIGKCPNLKKSRLRRFSFVFPYREIPKCRKNPPPAVFLCVPL